MDILSLIPSYTETLPANYNIFVFLFLLTFLIHILFVNLVLGGSIILLISRYIARYFHNNNYSKISEEIGYINTYNISFAITTGVAPLLFIQVLYDKFFYTSSIMLSYYWLSILLAIVIAYYFYYIFKFKPFYLKFRLNSGTIYILIATILFLYVALILVINTLISLQPDLWPDIYLGKSTITHIKTLLPRYLHFIFASVAFSGVFLMCYGKVRKSLDDNLKKEFLKLGKFAFIIPTMIQFIIGPWFLFSHKPEFILYFLKLNSTGSILIVIAIILVIYSLYLTIKDNKPLLVFSINILIILSMVIVRRIVEMLYLAPFSAKIIYTTKAQFLPFVMFLTLLILAVFLFVFLYFKIQRSLRGGNASNLSH